MKTFYELSQSLQEDLHTKHNFSMDQHKAALKYHENMRAAHSHADDHEPGDTHHHKAAERHGEAAYFHSKAIDSHKKGGAVHIKNSNNAHDESIKANKSTSRAHRTASYTAKYRKRFDDHLKKKGGAINPYGRKKK